MRPDYVNKFIPPAEASVIFQHVLSLAWLKVREARQEFFMSTMPVTYVYGKGDAAQSYISEPYTSYIFPVQDLLNRKYGTRYNVCFLNRYDGQQNQLGWHADDSSGTDLDHPIAVISFGADREIWWKAKEFKGVVPPEQRQLLGHGSLFVMPAGFQREHFHRIPKSDRKVDARVSLTFRRLTASEKAT